MPLPRPPLTRTRLHTRRVTYECFRRDDDLFELEGHLTDVKDHDYALLRVFAAPAMPCTTCGRGSP